MTVSLIKYPDANDWHLVEMIARTTANLPAKAMLPTESWKKRILKARHSPIRELRFVFMLKDIPYWVSVHLCRHVHAQPYVASQRNDRQSNYDRRKAPQDTPVTMIWSMNAESLCEVANKRLCYKASAETREVVTEMCRKVCEVCPEFAEELVPMCVRNGGVCYEMKPCNEIGRGKR